MSRENDRPGAGRRPAPGQGGSAQGKAAKGQRRGLLGVVLEVVVIVAAAFAIAMLVQYFLIKPFTIHQISMESTLLEGDRILLSRLTYHFRDPEAGDVIVFDSPVNQNEDLVKRVVAVAGDTVEIRQGLLYVNGQAQDEPYLNESPFEGQDERFDVPEGTVFVMGDNRNDSGDSRLFGPIDVDSVIGKAFVIYWPISRWGGL